jgi:hypothetical protein
MFYLYQHIRPDTGAVFYVGKGSKKRLRSRSHRNNHWKAIVAKAGGFNAEIVFKDDDEELIFLAEEERIDQLRKMGCALSNQTDGGKGGIKGYRHSEETRQKISENRKGKYSGSNHPRYGLFGKDNPMYGFKQSESARRGMSENCSMKRPEVVAKLSGEKSTKAKTILFDGKVFKTMIELAKYEGVSPNTIRTRICRYGAEKYGYKILGNSRQLAKDFMQDQDLAPLNAAIAANK